MARKKSDKTPVAEPTRPDHKKSKGKPPSPLENSSGTKKGKKTADAEEGDDPTKPRRGRAIGDNFGWTGKLPMTFLNELAQKQKWGRVEYLLQQHKNEFSCTVVMKWQNPKTKENIAVKMVPEPHLVRTAGNANEARHFGATYALHRINYVKNMKMVLPQIFGDYWSELEKERAELLKTDKEKHDSTYNAQPFLAFIERREKREKAEKERLIRQQNDAKIKKPLQSVVSGKAPTTGKQIVKVKAMDTSIEATPTFPQTKWDSAPFIDFPSEVRASIEDSIKRHISWILESNHLTLAENPSDPDYEKFTETLKSFGFRGLHIKEAFEYTSTFKDALEWLLFHLPEDDLPPLFAKTEKDSGVSLTISRDMLHEYLVKRVAEAGFDKDDIEKTLFYYENDEVKTSVALTHIIAGLEPLAANQSFNAESRDLWVQELEGIQILESNKVEFVEGYNQDVATVELNVPSQPKGLFLLKLYRSGNYPLSIPGFLILVTQSKKLAAYIKQSVIEGVSNHLVQNGFVGDCMIFTAIDWVESNISRIIENPGSLIRGIELKVGNNSNLRAWKKSQKGSQYRLKPKVLLQDEIENLKTEYKKRIEMPQFKDSIRKRSALPAWKLKDQLVSVINSNKVTIVTGETGSGKSTQIVQFILDDLCQRGDFSSKIMCTQPRRISTIGLAERISEERVKVMGSETGYIIRGEKKTCADTRLTFATTGVLLRMLQTYLTAKSGYSIFDELSYIFIDEVHERSVDCDFLLIILKSVMKKFPKLRVVLMSATIKLDTFHNFFETPLNHMHIEGRTFPIEDYYLDEVLEKTNFTIESKADGVIKPGANSKFFKSGNINYELIAKLCEYVDTKLKSEKNDGSILIFLPGVMEISQCVKTIEEFFSKSHRDSWCLPLHSALTSQEQRRVFETPKAGTRKIVVSTNVAETSITIPDCVVVIDSGRSKMMFFDTKFSATRLIENWCSKAEIGQRRGRSGRITRGNCYHLYSKEVELEMIAQPIPEIKRTRLENLYLVVKAMGIDDVESFLNSGLDAPDQSSLADAKRFLLDIGAFENENMTNLGRYLSLIPADLLSGKLLILGCIFGCVDICLTLAALSTSPNPFLNHADVREKARQAKIKFSNNMGDMMAMANAYTAYSDLRRNSLDSRKFLTDHGLSWLTMQDITSTRVQYLSILKDIGFVPMGYRSHSTNEDHQFLNRNNQNKAVICAIITGAFYPQVARVQLPDAKYFKTHNGAVLIDQDAKQTKYWIRNANYHFDPEAPPQAVQPKSKDEKPELPAARSFVHPSSVIFGTDLPVPNLAGEILKKATDNKGKVDYEKARALLDWLPQVSKELNPALKAAFVVYGLSHHSHKLFLRDITPTTTLATLLFGGDISYNLTNYVGKGKSSPGIVLDNWMPIRTWCKNGVLIKRLRKLLDGVFEERLSRPYSRFQQDGNAEILEIIEQVLAL